MKITSIASSSAGCAYAVESNGSVILLDCGVSLKRIREAVPDLSKVVACLVSHEHGDHSGFLPKLEKETNIPIYCTEGSKKRFSLSNMVNTIRHTEYFDCGREFWVQPLRLEHDVECFGFAITDTPANRLLYITDTNIIGYHKNEYEKVDYKFVGLTHLMIEANHSFEHMIESSAFHRKRSVENHLDIDSVVEFVKRHPDLQEIWLLHLSSAHSNAEEFKERVQSVAGCIVKIAGE